MKTTIFLYCLQSLLCVIFPLCKDGQKIHLHIIFHGMSAIVPENSSFSAKWRWASDPRTRSFKYIYVYLRAATDRFPMKSSLLHHLEDCPLYIGNSSKLVFNHKNIYYVSL